MAVLSNNLRKYETVYVLKPELDDKSAQNYMLKIKTLISDNGGQNVKITCWGRKKLAWEKDKHQRGIFVHHSYLGKGQVVSEFERMLGIDEEVLMRQTVIVKDNVDPKDCPSEEDELEVPVIKEKTYYQQRNYFANDNFNSAQERN